MSLFGINNRSNLLNGEPLPQRERLAHGPVDWEKFKGMEPEKWYRFQSQPVLLMDLELPSETILQGEHVHFRGQAQVWRIDDFGKKSVFYVNPEDLEQITDPEELKRTKKKAEEMFLKKIESMRNGCQKAEQEYDEIKRFLK